MDILMSVPTLDSDADLVIYDGDLVLDQGIQTPIVLSLLSDARANVDDTLSTNEDPRGWWGDSLSGTDSLGSKRWLLERSKQTSSVAEDLRQADLKALSWLVLDGIVQKIDVDVTRSKQGHYREDVKVTHLDGREELLFSLWGSALKGGLNAI